MGERDRDRERMGESIQRKKIGTNENLNEFDFGCFFHPHWQTTWQNYDLLFSRRKKKHTHFSTFTRISNIWGLYVHHAHLLFIQTGIRLFLFHFCAYRRRFLSLSGCVFVCVYLTQLLVRCSFIWFRFFLSPLTCIQLRHQNQTGLHKKRVHKTAIKINGLNGKSYVDDQSTKCK